MLIVEYAIDPNVVATNWRDCEFVLAATGVENGRLIAQFPENWISAAWEAASCCPETEKAKIVLLLASLKEGRRSHFAPRNESDYDTNRTWLANACAEHQNAGFKAIVVSHKPDAAPEEVIGRENLDDNREPWRAERTIRVGGTSAELSSAVAMLLRISEHILFVDPYFRPDQNDKFQVMKAFLNEVANRRPGVECKTLQILVGNECGYDFIKTACERVLSQVGVVPSGLTLKVLHLEPRTPVRERLHDRFILTERGGVQFGAGFEQRPETERQTLSLLDVASRKELFDVYFRKRDDFFTLGGDPIVIPSTQTQLGRAGQPRRRPRGDGRF